MARAFFHYPSPCFLMGDGQLGCPPISLSRGADKVFLRAMPLATAFPLARKAGLRRKFSLSPGESVE